jgi:hypothetical protein
VQRQRRRVLLRAGEHGRDLPVERVVEDAPPHLRVGHGIRDQLLERPLRVDADRGQRIARGVVDPQRAARLGRHWPRVRTEAPGPQRIGQPRRGIDRAHQRPPPAPRRQRAHRRRGRGLAHAAGPEADENALRIDQAGDHLRRHAVTLPTSPGRFRV